MEGTLVKGHCIWWYCTERQKMLFYSTLYRSFLWPALRSDANGDFTDRAGKDVNKGFKYYTEPSL